MPVPEQSILYRPILEFTASDDESLSQQRIVQLLSDQFNLTETDRQEKSPFGKEPLIEVRTKWATFDLKKAGFLHYPSRGCRAITQEGRKFLDTYEGEITVAFIRQLSTGPQQADGNANETASGNVKGSTDVAPEDLMAQGDQRLRERLADELLETIIKSKPKRFEQLVVSLLEKMGYGKGEAVGRSGDGGIDGIINQDPLGLEKVYIQAKRWSGQVGEPEVRNFSGSLDAKGAARGVFITNSTFSSTARETARNISAGNKLIRLIDGQELVKLMIQYGVGVVTESTYEVKKMDENYFAEDV